MLIDTFCWLQNSMNKIILALAIMTTTAAVQIPLAFATPPPTAPPSTPGCTGNPHGFFGNIPINGKPTLRRKSNRKSSHRHYRAWVRNPMLDKYRTVIVKNWCCKLHTGTGSYEADGLHSSASGT
jgi:hypothetical protein